MIYVSGTWSEIELEIFQLYLKGLLPVHYCSSLLYLHLFAIAFVYHFTLYLALSLCINFSYHVSSLCLLIIYITLQVIYEQRAIWNDNMDVVCCGSILLDLLSKKFSFRSC